MALKYKVGDRVRIKSIDWYNENRSKSHGTVACGGKYFDYDMREWCGKIMTILTAYQTCYIMKEDGAKDLWTDEMIECKVEEETKPIDFTIKVTDTKGKVEVVIPEGYSYVIENDKLYFITEKKEVTYPKTYEECCEIFQYNKNLKVYPPFNADIPNYDALHLFDLLEALRKLRICRDAYWKIAGEEMGLGKPWEPDWINPEQLKYTIYYYKGDIKKDYWHCHGHILAFPTEEMMEEFYENFKKEIEMCKELL